MTPQRLRRIAIALYGDGDALYEGKDNRLKSEASQIRTALLAKALGVDLRTCQRWLTGDRHIPGMEADLSYLCEMHSTRLEEIARELALEAAEKAARVNGGTSL